MPVRVSIQLVHFVAVSYWPILPIFFTIIYAHWDNHMIGPVRVTRPRRIRVI